MDKRHKTAAEIGSKTPESTEAPEATTPAEASVTAEAITNTVLFSCFLSATTSIKILGTVYPFLGGCSLHQFCYPFFLFLKRFWIVFLQTQIIQKIFLYFLLNIYIVSRL